MQMAQVQVRNNSEKHQQVQKYLINPFKATMVSVSEAPPTKPVTLVNMTLGLINNLLIINPPPDKVQQAVDEQNTKSTNVLDVDF